MILVEAAQGSAEWLAARVGVITSSRAKDACKTLKNGDPAEVAIAYAAQIALERVSGVRCDETFVNAAMRRGTELEPQARAAYEAETGNLVLESGIVLTDDRAFGYSTDGLIGADGLLEIKCPSSPKVVCSMWRDGDVSEYMHQIQMGLWITGRKWLDFVMYDPRLEVVGKALFVKRIERDEAFIESLEIGLLRCAKLADEFAAAICAEQVLCAA
jgi:exodeoxyribonuclease (lambda-induced)